MLTKSTTTTTVHTPTTSYRVTLKYEAVTTAEGDLEGFQILDYHATPPYPLSNWTRRDLTDVIAAHLTTMLIGDTYVH